MYVVFLQFIKKNTHIIYFSVLSVLSVLALFNSLTFYINPYAKLAWSVDYSFGFCKRGFLGYLYGLFSTYFNIPRTESSLTMVMFSAHALSSVVFVVLFLFLYEVLSFKISEKRGTVFAVFCFFITSHFVRTSLGYTGYHDIFLLDLYLLILILISKSHIYFACFLSSLFCLITELSCVFWIPILLVKIIFEENKRIDLVLFSPLLVGLFIHNFTIPYDHFQEFALANGFSLNSDSLKNLKVTYMAQYNLFDALVQRVTFVNQHAKELLCSFFILGSILFVNIFINVCIVNNLILKKSRKNIAHILFVSVTFLPMGLYLVAIDFWRFVGFCIFSSFLIFVTILLYSKPVLISSDSINKTKLSSPVYIIGFFLSFITTFSPQLCTFGSSFTPVSPHVQENMYGESLFVFPTFLWNNELFYTILSYFPFAFYDSYNELTLSNLSCPASGKRFYGGQQRFGKVVIVIDSSFLPSDADENKYVQLWGSTFKLNKAKRNVFYYDVKPAFTKMYPWFMINVLPSSSDWEIQSLYVKVIESVPE
jgi:hypothetical protein